MFAQVLWQRVCKGNVRAIIMKSFSESQLDISMSKKARTQVSLSF